MSRSIRVRRFMKDCVDSETTVTRWGFGTSQALTADGKPGIA
jgi:hypothetical protein